VHRKALEVFTLTPVRLVLIASLLRHCLASTRTDLKIVIEATGQSGERL
jgi:hypothetical protein